MMNAIKPLLIIASFFSVSLAHGQSTETGKTSTTVTSENSRLNDRFNIRISEPHWLAFSEVNVEAMIRIGSHFAAGPTLGYMAEDDAIHVSGKTYDYLVFDDKNTRYQVGLKAAYYFNHVNESGVYINAFGRHAHTEVKRATSSTFSGLITDKTGSAQFDEFIYGATSGYQWQIGRLRVFVGGGYQFYNSPSKVTIDYDNSTETAVLDDIDNSGSIVIDGGVGLTF